MQASQVSLLDDAFALLQQAASEAATSQHNDRRPPTAAQAKAGNYKKARYTLHSLPLAIENEVRSLRTDTSKGGKDWANRQAAHYGDIEGTVGADGDPIDVFIGPFPESRLVWVINQGWPGGSFDEHKVMLAFATEQQARDAYLGSYDRGWTGLQSIVPCTIEQLRWWLKYGDTKRALSVDQLPFEASPAMNKTLWTPDAEPIGTTLNKLLYDVRVDDSGAGLLLDAVTLPDLLDDPDLERALLDALVVPVARMTQRMDQMQRVMDAAGTELKVTGYTVSDPIKARGVLQVAVLFALSDGQAITIWFHNPDTTPAKLTPLDELISWKWVLNKKDITIVVAPERGRELNPREVAHRIMRLAEKNSAAFKKANAALAEKMAALSAIDDEIVVLEGRLADLTEQVDAARSRKDVEADDQAARDANPTTPEGYAKIAGDDAALVEAQDMLDALFQERLIAVRNELRGLGWEGEHYGKLTKAGAEFGMSSKRIGGGRNIVSVEYLVFKDDAPLGGVKDDLTKSPAAIAAELDAVVPQAQAEPAPVEVAESVEPVKPVAEPEPEPMTAELYAAIRENDIELEKRAAELDTLLAARYKAVIEALIALGWESQAGSARKGAVAVGVFKRSPDSSDNIVALSYSLSLPGDFPDSDFILRDTLAEAPSEMAASINAEADRVMALAAEQAAPTPEKRIAEIREALRAIGWEGSGGEPMDKAGHFAVPEAGNVGNDGVVAASWTITGVPGFFMSDTLERTAEEVAAGIDSGLTSFLAQREEQERAAADRAMVEAAVEAAKRGAGGITRLVTSQWFTFEFDGDEALLTPELRAEVEAALGEPLVEHVFPGLEGEIALVPGSMKPASATSVKRVTKKQARDAYDALTYRVNDLQGHTPLEFFKADVPASLAEPVAAVQALVDRGWPQGETSPAGVLERAQALIEQWKAGQAEGVSAELGRGDASRYLRDKGLTDAQIEPILAAPSGNTMSGEIEVPHYTTAYLDEKATEANAAAALPTEGDTTPAGEQVDPKPVDVPVSGAIEGAPDEQIAVIEPGAADGDAAADRAYLESLVDGTGDLLAEDTFARLEPMFAKYTEGTEMYALLEKAATAYGDAAVAAAQKALAPA